MKSANVRVESSTDYLNERSMIRPSLLSFVCFLFLMHNGPADAQDRARIVLTKGWHVRQLETDDPDIAALTREAARPDDAWMAAEMPAQVHDILLAHGRIPDPRIGRNAAECAWVGEEDWAYACTFTSPPNKSAPAFLHFDGLDTLAKAYLNGKLIGRFDNMYRQYAVDVRSRLSPSDEDNASADRGTLFTSAASEAEGEAH